MRLNPYKQNDLWYQVMMKTHFKCAHDACGHRHAVHVDDMVPVCVYHMDGATHAIKQSHW